MLDFTCGFKISGEKCPPLQYAVIQSLLEFLSAKCAVFIRDFFV
jgi:hypothetical protein